MRSVLGLLVLLTALAAAPAAEASPGELDARFGDAGLGVRIGTSGGDAMARDPRGRIYVAAGGYSGAVVLRFTAGGRLDRSYGRGGRSAVVAPSALLPVDLLLQPDGKLLVAGGDGMRIRVARLLADGTLDPTWEPLRLEPGPRSFYAGAARLSDGGLAIAATVHATDQHLLVMRFDAQGRLDPSFAGDGIYDHPGPAAARALLARPDGRLLVAGTSGSFYGALGTEMVIGLTSAGALDETWAGDGVFEGSPRATPLRLAAHDGGVLVLESRSAVLALDATGHIRENFGVDGRAAVPATNPTAIAVGDDARIYVAGLVWHWYGPRATVAALQPNGWVDPSFGRRGLAMLPRRRSLRRSAAGAVMPLADERILVAGSGADRYADIREDYGRPRVLVARLKNWPPVAYLWTKSRKRRVFVAAHCTRRGPCTGRLVIRDRRGRVLHARELAGPTRRWRHTRRPLRRGERLTITWSAQVRGGLYDRVQRKVWVR